VIEIPPSPDATQVLSPLPGFARSAGAPWLAGSGGADESSLQLPKGKAIALSVIAGPARGLVFQVDKPRIVLGRADADIVINDKEISRWHCAIEIKGDIIRLRDMDSTNGTYYAEERVRVAELKHLSEFRSAALTAAPFYSPCAVSSARDYIKSNGGRRDSQLTPRIGTASLRAKQKEQNVRLAQPGSSCTSDQAVVRAPGR
jgi:pSer/pThr/pTyr-binding forkhead associated (FHA) protein